MKFDISDYTFTGETYEVQDIDNFDFVDDLVVPEFEKLGYTQEQGEEAVEEVFNDGNYEVVKKDYEIEKFYNQTISRKDFGVSGHIEWHFEMFGEKVVLFSDFNQGELYDNQEAQELFEKLISDLRDNGWEQFLEQFNDWAKDKILVNNLGEKVTEEDVRIEYNNLADDDLYEAYDPDIISDKYEFDFDFDNLRLEYIEEEY